MAKVKQSKKNNFDVTQRNWSRLTKAAFGKKMDGCYTIGYTVRMLINAVRGLNGDRAVACERLIRFIGSEMQDSVTLGNPLYLNNRPGQMLKRLVWRIQFGDSDLFQPKKGSYYQRPHPQIAGRVAAIWGIEKMRA